jgi:hypothetical protein
MAVRDSMPSDTLRFWPTEFREAGGSFSVRGDVTAQRGEGAQVTRAYVCYVLTNLMFTRVRFRDTDSALYEDLRRNADFEPAR